ncbi:MAG: hypothetical protein KQH53_15125 [Desulfarculaceae bacterium]|nr:hypothetical protein [Desulfarculaceae bacterium]
MKPDRLAKFDLSPYDRLLARLAGHEAKFRDVLEKALCRSQTYLRYRNAGLLELLRLVAALIEREQLDCLITGGLAYDAMRGRLSRVHHDLDLMCLAPERPRVLAAFAAAGLKIVEKSPYHAIAHLDDVRHVDVFSWREVPGEAMENIVGGILVRAPLAFRHIRQTASLYGLRLTLPGNAYLKSISPFVESAEDRRFLAQLPTDPVITCESRTETVVRRISLAVHEFGFPSDPEKTSDDPGKSAFGG